VSEPGGIELRMRTPVSMHGDEAAEALEQDHHLVLGLRNLNGIGRVDGASQPWGQAMSRVVEFGRIVALEVCFAARTVRELAAKLAGHVRRVRDLPHSVEVRVAVGEARNFGGAGLGQDERWRHQENGKESSPHSILFSLHFSTLAGWRR